MKFKLKLTVVCFSFIILLSFTVHLLSQESATNVNVKIMNPYAGSGFYVKGNTHCHNAPGNLGRELWDVVTDYRNKAYDFIVLTHYAWQNCSNYSSEDFLCINGQEMGHPLGHILGLGTNKEIDPDLDQQEIIDEIKRQGGVVEIGHPYTFRRAILFRLKGIDLFEIMNYGHDIIQRRYNLGIEPTKLQLELWDELLRKGEKVYAVAVDDSHFPYERGHYWVMCKVKSLDKASVLQALKSGACYSSSGPKMDFDVERNTITAYCHSSFPIKHMVVKTALLSRSSKNNFISFTVRSPVHKYVRFECEDEAGFKAFSNPFFISGG